MSNNVGLYHAWLCGGTKTIKMETGVEKIKLKPESFEPIKERFISLIDKDVYEKECSFAIQHLMKNSYLASSTPTSILMSVLNLAQIGLTLNPALKLAYLVPRRVKGVVECVLEPSYMGLCKLATDTGSVKSIYSHCIYSNDTFKQSLGTSPEIIHEPPVKNRGEIIGVYAVAVLQDGNRQIEVMSLEDIVEIRNTSESYKSFEKNGEKGSCIWVDYFDEMSRKTVIKRLCKYLPKTEMWDKLSKAIEIMDEDFAITYNQASLIEDLLHQATIPEERKEQISRSLNTYRRSDASDLIEELKSKQVDPMQSLGYSQTDIKNAVGKIK